MPVSTSQRNLIRIACNACISRPSTSDSGAIDDVVTAAATASSDTDSSALLEDLRLKIQETKSAIFSLTNEVYDRWTLTLRSSSATFRRLEHFVAMRLTVTIEGDTNLTEDQRKLMQILLQASNFVLYLENEETQAAYGPKKNSLADLKGRMLQVVCATRQLLEEFSDNDIEVYVQTHTHLHLQLTVDKEILKRTVCAIALKVMTTALNSTSL
ncbi:hypothetical protein RRG08_006671 [Elysia crispata]|uniref:Uncharacterized protein n=1 Tax=Elysia crispata TaxID=231223 RepID=A0AAE0YX09_9GAST|nr:hypothetical protein RRG08_006671 [Elysia crispata]